MNHPLQPIGASLPGSAPASLTTTASSPNVLAVSVVIPSHNEEHVIGRCLQALTDGAQADELEIIVVCNGCSDRTAAIARTWPATTVVELSEVSKSAALNAGDLHATRFPRF